MNMYGCWTVMQLCIWAEYLGVCHFSWLLYNSCSSFFCRSVRMKALETDFKSKNLNAGANLATSESNSALTEVELDKPMGLWDIFRYTWSTFVTFCAVFLILTGIGRGYAILPSSVGVCYIVLIIFLGLLFYLEGLMICIVATQFWDRETFKDIYPRAYKLHEIVNRPENLKRFIIGRQFFTVLSNILLSQVTAFPAWGHGSAFNKAGFYVIIQSGIIGAMTTLAFAQLNPELLAAEFPLRFMDLIGSYSVVRVALFIEAIGIGHCAWAIYFATRRFCCGEHSDITEIRPQVLRVNSQEVLLVTPTSPTVTESVK